MGAFTSELTITHLSVTVGMVGAYGAWQSPVDTIDPAAVALGRKDRLMEELAHAPLTPEQRAEIAKKAAKK